MVFNPLNLKGEVSMDPFRHPSVPSSFIVSQSAVCLYLVRSYSRCINEVYRDAFYKGNA